MAKKSVRIVIKIVALLIVVVLAASAYFYYRFHQALPQQSGRIQAGQLQQTVEITYDEMDIPQIWAQNEHDAFFATGYLHASERLFQMDMTRRVSQGRLAELLGESVLNIDKYQRMVGHYRIAQKYLKNLSPQNRARLQAYADGVNYYIQKNSTLPFEFQLLGKDFKPWSVFDCLTILSFQTWFSDFLMSSDDLMARHFDTMDHDKLSALDFTYPAWAPRTIPPQDNPLSLREKFGRILAQHLTGFRRLPFLMSNSSNSWVVDPRHSQSGGAMLASDPHLEVRRLPQFWYVLGIHAADTKLNVLGISTPGLPLIIMGHNGQAAWAFTVGGIDVNEYYQEKINPNDSTAYLTPDGWKKMVMYPQEVYVSGEEQPRRFNVWETRHGPVAFKNDSLKQAYALHWAGYDTNLDTTFSAAFRLMRVADYQQFRSTVTKMGALDANWTYADVKGNIGYQLGTPIAIRPGNSHNMPVPGWTNEYEWQGFYPLEDTPHSFNPDRGWLATCNNKQQDFKAEYTLYGKFFADRILRITQLLQSKEKFSVQDMYDFQMDITNPYILRWKSEIVRLLKKAGFAQEIPAVSHWQGVTSDTSHAAAVFNMFLTRLKHNIFADELGDNMQKLFYTDVETIYFSGPDSWFDNIHTPEIETREDIALKSIKETVQYTQGKRWGDILKLTMAHPLSIVPVISDVLHLSFGPVPWHGSEGTLNVALSEEDKTHPEQLNVLVGASWRFVIDFSNPDAATMVIPAGNSGHPLSPHFMDFFDMWKTGQRWNVPISKKKVYARALNTLVLGK